jgi:hypothetical protein
LTDVSTGQGAVGIKVVATLSGSLFGENDEASSGDQRAFDIGRRVEAVSDELGAYRLEGLQENQNYRIKVDSMSYVPLKLAPTFRASINGGLLDIALAPGYLGVFVAEQEGVVTYAGLAGWTVNKPLISATDSDSYRELGADFHHAWESLRGHMSRLFGDKCMALSVVAIYADSEPLEAIPTATASWGIARRGIKKEIALKRFEEWRKEDAFVFKESQCLEKHDQVSQVDLQFTRLGEPLGFIPPFIIYDSQHQDFLTCITAHVSADSKLTVRLPQGEYHMVAAIDFSASWIDVPFVFAPQKFSVRGATRIPIELDHPCCLVKFALKDSFGRPLKGMMSEGINGTSSVSYGAIRVFKKERDENISIWRWESAKDTRKDFNIRTKPGETVLIEATFGGRF